LEAARTAWAAGAYDGVLAALDGLRPNGREERLAAAALAARALLALGRPEEVPALLDPVRKDAKSPADTALVDMLLGAALARTARRAEGDALLEQAAAGAARSAVALAPEIDYYRALSRWSAHRLDDAEAIVERALTTAKDAVRSRLLQLLGWIDVRRENYGAASHAFTAALEELERSRQGDASGRASILHALGIIAAETIDMRLARLVRREFEAARWTDATRIERFQVLEYLSWLSLLEGEIARAWEERQLALTLTTDTSYHAIALIQAAHLAGVVGDRFAESRYVALAGALLLRGDQVGIDVERRIALLAFALTAPASAVDTTRRVLTLYERSRPRRTALLAFEDDRRLEAYEMHARAKLALAERKTSQGVAELRRSLELWTTLACRLRTAMAASDLLAATGERHYAQTGLDALRNAPKAWLRRVLEHGAAQEDPLAQLTPAERRVLAELCKGRKAREIAETFGRSFNTINNHTRSIFSAFGVRSRAALVAECARLGVLEAPERRR
jgi:DNA-binding NarL/FixJ family response regulator